MTQVELSDAEKTLKAQNDAMKQELLNVVHEKFNDLALTFNKIGCNSKLKDIALMNLDQFKWWAFEAIRCTNFAGELVQQETPEPLSA